MFISRWYVTLSAAVSETVFIPFRLKVIIKFLWHLSCFLMLVLPKKSCTHSDMKSWEGWEKGNTCVGDFCAYVVQLHSKSGEAMFWNDVNCTWAAKVALNFVKWDGVSPAATLHLKVWPQLLKFCYIKGQDMIFLVVFLWRQTQWGHPAVTVILHSSFDSSFHAKLNKTTLFSSWMKQTCADWLSRCPAWFQMKRLLIQSGIIQIK